MFRRRYGTFQWLSLPMSFPATQMVPASGSSSLVNSRRNVVLPDPEGPTWNTNSPLAMSTEASRMATVVPLYDLVTCSSLIIVKEQYAPTGAQWLDRLPVKIFDRRDGEPCYPCWERRQRRYASMKASSSPSRTACTLPVSYLVRSSFTIWYGART